VIVAGVALPVPMTVVEFNPCWSVVLERGSLTRNGTCQMKYVEGHEYASRHFPGRTKGRQHCHIHVIILPGMNMPKPNHANTLLVA